MPNGRPYSAADDLVLLHGHGTLRVRASVLGRGYGSARSRRDLLLLKPTRRAPTPVPFSAEELAALLDPQREGSEALAARFGRNRNCISRKAAALGVPFAR